MLHARSGPSDDEGRCPSLVPFMFLPSVRTADPQDALRFFRNYFVTGDYAVGGVGLRTIDGTADDQDGLADGFATRTIHFNDVNGNAVPADANILAAFLYWQTVVTTSQGSGTDGAQFRGQDIAATIERLQPIQADISFLRTPRMRLALPVEDQLVS